MARVRRTSGPLDLRAQAILRAVIEEYVGTATPVSSQALVERYRLGVSSATVRNVLAELEAAGLLTHPHTSAGRVPTDAGYRLYVEAIVDLAPLPAVEQLMIRHQFGQVEFTSEHWFRLAATTLASVTRSAGLATPAKPRAATVRRVDVLAINDRLASLIVVLREGSIKQQLVALDRPVEAAWLAAVAQRVNELAIDVNADQLERRLGRLQTPAASPGPADTDDRELVAVFAERVLRTLRDYDQAAIEELFSDGLLNVMSAPEFAEPQKLRRVWTVLENRAYLADLFRRVAGGGDEVRVFIGTENRPEEMSDVALVLAPYGQPGRAMGVVGVLGPTRMRYPHAMGTVRFVSTLMNELVEHLYA
ncbi:MAG TPA: heat-inducible transcriptional repressor HrcA [Candidatus Limnocylindrales bacterium]